MGVFTFKWPHAAEEVYVTGTFDNWSKSEQLSKTATGFEKTVTLPEVTERIFYKFVVDGKWTTDHTAPQAKDSEGNENNVLHPEDIKASPAAAALMSGVTPGSTTAALAASAPLEKNSSGSPPGAFPETPAADLDKQFSVNPLPATEGAVNPVKLAPGEKIPSNLTSSGVNSHVTLDKESYEKSDRLPGVTDVGTLPPVSGNMIPESSLPIVGGNATINSAAPHSTTAALAGKVPLEPAVPETVRESQNKAGVDPEASGISSEVQEKSQVENELLKKVPEAPSTSEGTAGKGTEKSEGDKTLAATVTATAAAAGASVLAAAYAAKDAVIGGASTATTQATAAAANLPDSVKSALPVSAQQAIAGQSKEATVEQVSPEVPSEVKASIAEAGTGPEAASNTLAVEEKKKVEAELLKEVKTVKPIDEAAPETPVKKAVEAVTPSKNAESSTPATSSTKATTGDSSTPTKKKNRLSVIINKIKTKVSHKDK